MPLIRGKSTESFRKNVSTEMHEGKPLKQSLAIAYAMKKKAKKSHGGMVCDEGCEMLHEHNYAKGGHVESMESGVNHPVSEEEPGMSYAGRHARMSMKAKEMGDEESAAHNMRAAKSLHKFRLKEELPELKHKDRKYLAHGGVSDDDEPMPSSSPSPYEAAAASIKKALAGPSDEAVAAAPEEMKEDKNPVSASMKKIFKTPGYGDGGIVEIIMHKRKGMSEGGQVANDVGMGASADLEDNQFDDLVLRDDLESSYDGANSGDELGNAGEDERRMDIVSKIMASRRKKDRLPRPA